MSYFNKYNLLNSKIGEGVAENSPLWSLELYLMNNSAFVLSNLISFIGLCQTNTIGLYNQRPDNNGSKEDYMSPDQLIAFVGALYLLHPAAVQPIWRYFWRHGFTYNNLTGKTDIRNIQQPAAVFFVAICAGHRYLLPILSVICFISCFFNADQTSGKLKAWTMIEVLKMNKTKSICSFILSIRSDFKNWSGCFREYFPIKDHPIHEIALKRRL